MNYPDKRNLYFRLYFGGMSNVRMSLDIGIALAHLTGRTLVPYNVRQLDLGHSRLLSAGSDFRYYSKIFDLMDIPVNVDNRLFFTDRTSEIDAHLLYEGSFVHSVFYYPDSLGLKSPWVRDFVNGRDDGKVFTLDKQASQAEALCVGGRTLAMYSYFLCLKPVLHKTVNKLLAGVDAKQPYRELAARISEKLGAFNALHIRRGDFVAKKFTPRSAQVTADEIIRNTADILDRNDTLLICTDDPNDEAFFEPFRKHYRKLVFIDRLLVEDREYADKLRELPFHDNAVVALMSQLIASHAVNFVGTLFSTFTALVQRRRGLLFGDQRFLYAYNDFGDRVSYSGCVFHEVKEGRYSWNRLALPLAPEHLSWCREWPEVFDGVTPGG